MTQDTTTATFIAEGLMDRVRLPPEIGTPVEIDMELYPDEDTTPAVFYIERDSAVFQVYVLKVSDPEVLAIVRGRTGALGR